MSGLKKASRSNVTLTHDSTASQVTIEVFQPDGEKQEITIDYWEADNLKELLILFK